LSADDIRVAAEAAESDYKRAVELLKAGSMNREAYDKLKFKWEDASVRLGWSNIKSPLDGTVLTRYHEARRDGQPRDKTADHRRPQTPVGRTSYVPQPLLAKLSTGMQVKGLVPEDNNRAAEGSIEHITTRPSSPPKNVADEKGKDATCFRRQGSLARTDDTYLKPGMTVRVTLHRRIGVRIRN